MTRAPNTEPAAAEDGAIEPTTGGGAIERDAPARGSAFEHAASSGRPADLWPQRAATHRCASCGARIDPLRAGRVAAFGDKIRYFCDPQCRDSFDERRSVENHRQPFEAHPSVLGAPSGPLEPHGTEPRGSAPEPSREGSDRERDGAGSRDRSGASRRDPPGSANGMPDRAAHVASGEVARASAAMARAHASAGDRMARGAGEPGSRADPPRSGPVGPISGHGRAVDSAGAPSSGRTSVTGRARSAPFLAARYATEPSRPVRERDLALTGTAVFLGVLGATLVLAGESAVVFALRGALAVAGFALLAVRRARGRSDPLELHAWALLGPPAAAIAVACWSSLVRDGSRAESATFADLLVAASALALHVVDRLRRAGSAESDSEIEEVAALDRTRIDVSSRTARTARRIGELGGIGGAVLAGLAAFSNSEPSVRIVLASCAGYFAFATAAVIAVAPVCIGRAVREATGRMIGYRSPGDWDRASEVGIAAFCARGTLLLGEPELVDVEVMGGMDANRVLSLVAGAEAADRHPVAVAIQRAAASRRIEPDAVRSPSLQPGLGVMAVASSGEPLVVGSRTLMLREKISVAMMEREIAELEARGRTVLLVALGGRVVGLIGLQDGLRPGARAAVQHLLDAQIEPVLLSGDSRETCEAIAHALDIDHVRPEVLPADRPREIQRLAEGGVTVAVFGRAVIDDPALSAAHVGVALARPEAAAAKWPISLPTDDLRDAAEAVALARKARLQARAGTVLALAPGLLAVLAVGFAVAPPGWVPVGAALGALLSGLYVRAGDLARTESEPAWVDPLA